MNRADDRDDELTKYLAQRGHSQDEIDKIKQHLAQYDYETQHDSIFDSVASGNLDLDAIVREALGDQESS